MRLIDADELKRTICRDQCEKDGCDYTCSDISYVVNAPTVCKWVSVKDMYPRKGQTVIALLSYTRTHIEYELAEFNGKYFDADDAYLPSQLVTHWMPLPEPPKGNNKGVYEHER